MNSTQQQIQALIQSFSKDLELLVRRRTLEMTLERLTIELDEPKKQTAHRSPKSKPANSSPVVKRSHESDAERRGLSDEILAHLKQNSSERAVDIAAALKTDTDTLHLPMKKLLAAQIIQSQGARRGMRYSILETPPVTSDQASSSTVGQPT